ncbi:MAG: histidine decarboxylase, pyruvoyl type [Lentisphaerota bacterium]
MHNITRRLGGSYSFFLGISTVLFVVCCFPGVFVCSAEKPGGEPALSGLPAVVKGAVGPFEKYCDGSGNAGASGLGYICALILDIGMVEQDMDTVLNGIVAYDRAEAKGAYIGQINMMVASMPSTKKYG